MSTSEVELGVGEEEPQDEDCTKSEDLTHLKSKKISDKVMDFLEKQHREFEGNLEQIKSTDHRI